MVMDCQKLAMADGYVANCQKRLIYSSGMPKKAMADGDVANCQKGLYFWNAKEMALSNKTHGSLCAWNFLLGAYRKWSGTLLLAPSAKYSSS